MGRANYVTPLAHAFEQAGREAGYPNGDVNGENQFRFSIPQTFTKDGKRWSTAKVFKFYTFWCEY